MGLLGAGGGIEHASLGLQIGVTHIDLQQEAVELGFRQGVGAFLLQRILRRQDMKRRGQGIALAGDGHRILLHRLQQG